MRKIFKMMAISVIRFYQKTISFDHGVLRFLYPHGFCRFYPSCSEYAAQAIKKKGIIQGSGLATKRLLRCNPFSDGGIDKIK